MHSSSRQKEGQELFYYFISFCLPCFCAAGKSCVAFCLCVASVKSKGSVLLPLRCLLPLRLRSQKQREVKSKGKAKVTKSSTLVQLNPNWVTGFMDGEGSFIIAILPSTGPLKKKISLRISITQKAHSKIVLFYLQDRKST